jgi:hypothetical protein
MTKRRYSPEALRRKRAHLAARLSDLEEMLRGTLVTRYKKCGKPGCHCTQGKGHGPAYYLSVTLSPGKTRSYYVPAKLRRIVERYVANYRTFRSIAEEITRINRELLERGELEGGD